MLLFSATVPHAFSVVAVVALSVLPIEQRQLVADEWMGRLWRRVARNPLRDLHALVESAQAGRFVPALAGEEAERRAAALAARAAADQSSETKANPPNAPASDATTLPEANQGGSADETKRTG